MKTLLAWLKDVYQKYGYIAVLVCIVVVVALIVGISLLLHVDISAIAKWLGMY